MGGRPRPAHDDSATREDAADLWARCSEREQDWLRIGVLMPRRDRSFPARAVAGAYGAHDTDPSKWFASTRRRLCQQA
jgi:hypothetical protein